MELNCALGGVLGPVSLSDSDDALEMPATEGWFPLSTDSPVGVLLMIVSVGVVAKRAPETLGSPQAQPFHETLGDWATYTAFRTSPVTSLCAKAQEMSLKNMQETVNELCFKLKTCPDNSAYSCVFEPLNSKLFEKSSLTPPLGLRIQPLFEDSKIDLDMVDDTTVSDTPPLSQSEPQICLSLTKYEKETTNP